MILDEHTMDRTLEGVELMTLNFIHSAPERAVVEEEYPSRNAEGYLRAYIKFARQMLSFSCYLLTLTPTHGHASSI